MIHYGYDTTSLANGTAKTIVDQGGKTWFFITADYAFGTQLQQAATKVVETNGGKVVGSVRAPLSTSDFSSYLLRRRRRPGRRWSASPMRAPISAILSRPRMSSASLTR